MPRIDVYYDGKPKELNAVGLAIFNVWQEFATGQRALGGRKLKAPTGTYASSLKVQTLAKNHVAILSDEGIAPHAKILETGRQAFDMLDHLQPGRSYPITRSRFVAGSGETRYAVYEGRRMTRRGSGVLRAGRFVASVSAVVRTPTSRAELAGRMNTSGRGPAWTVPAMPAYSPARLIAALFQRRVAAMGGTITSAR